MTTTHFTYGANHLDGAGLNKYTTIKGVGDGVARDIQVALHGDRWAFHYEDDDYWSKIVETHGLTCFETITVQSEE